MNSAYADSLVKEEDTKGSTELYTNLLAMPWVQRAIEGYAGGEVMELTKGVPSTLRTASSTYKLKDGSTGVFLYPTIRLINGQLRHFDKYEDAAQYAVDNNDLFLVGSTTDTSKVKDLEDKSTQLSKQLSEYIALSKQLGK